MVHSLPMAGGSHQRALTANSTQPWTDRLREGGRDEGKRKREIMRRGQTEVEKGRGSKGIRGERGGKRGEERRGRDVLSIPKELEARWK